MEEIWKHFPRELLSGIFKYLGPRHIKIPILKHMFMCDIEYMIYNCNFEDIVRVKNLTGCFLHTKYRPKAKIDWSYVSRECELCDSFIFIYHDRLHWFWVSYRQKLSEKVIDTFSNRLNWWNVSMSQDLSEYIKNKYKTKIVTRLSIRHNSSK